jgi:fatty acid amide hydrolase 2
VLRHQRAAATLHRMLDEDLLQVSALRLASLVQCGAVRASDVLATHISRIEQANPRINALVAARFDAAFNEAAAIDSLPEEARRELPLAGVPFTAKEMVAAEGMPATYGCGNRRQLRATADATVIARVRAAGGVLLGVSNVPEWGMWYETYNHVYGRTNNPWDTRRTAGGSSGGEAALVAAGCCALGIGTDIGGSIRMPAAFCGVFGHKPSGGLVPLTGIHPVHRDEDAALLPVGARGVARRRAPYLAAGPLTRSARDLYAVLRIMAGDDGIDPNVEAVTLADPAKVDWSGRRVVLLAGPTMKLARAADRAMQRASVRAADILVQRGAVLVEAPAALFELAGDIWFSALQEAGGPPFSQLLGAGRDVRMIRELVRAAAGRSVYSWPALFFVIGELIGQRGAHAMRRARSEAMRVRTKFDELLGDDGVFIMPVHPRAAPRHNAPVLRPFDFLYTGIFNALRVPATAVPFGFDDDGLPLSVQIAARHGRDDLTLAAACALEDAMPAWQPAPLAAHLRAAS